jgi:hypothetical protein
MWSVAPMPLPLLDFRRREMESRLEVAIGSLFW